MRSIRQIKTPSREGIVSKEKTILLRAGFDVPMENDRVVDTRRIQTLLPTMNYLIQKGPLIILSHQGRPRGKRDMNFSQKPLVQVLGKLLHRKVQFCDYCVGAEAEKMAGSLKKGEVLLLENLRFEQGEEENDPTFARKLARLGDIYVNDAFADAHRKHASIVGLPRYLPGFAGFQLLKEIKYLSLVSEKIKRPFLVILGGAKFETKLPLVKKFLNLADHIFLGGALANDFLKAKGYEVGGSLVERNDFGARKILENKKLILPVDVLVKKSGDSAAVRSSDLRLKKVDKVTKDEVILDVGDESVQVLTELVHQAQTILWNGPLGKYEAGGGGSTRKVLQALASSRARSIIGGGDTEDIISEMKLADKFYFVSTGGGAMLEFLAKGTLPGIKALK